MLPDAAGLVNSNNAASPVALAAVQAFSESTPRGSIKFHDPSSGQYRTMSLKCMTEHTNQFRTMSLKKLTVS